MELVEFVFSKPVLKSHAWYFQYIQILNINYHYATVPTAELSLLFVETFLDSLPLLPNSPSKVGKLSLGLFCPSSIIRSFLLQKPLVVYKGRGNFITVYMCRGSVEIACKCRGSDKIVCRCKYFCLIQ